MTVNIIKGEDKDITVRLESKASGDPYDLTSVTAITCCFANADASKLSLSLSAGIVVVTALIGKITITLTAAQTALLAEVSNATLEISTTKAGKIAKTRIEKAYSVIAKIC
jgi:hypothetical protein